MIAAAPRELISLAVKRPSTPAVKLEVAEETQLTGLPRSIPVRSVRWWAWIGSVGVDDGADVLALQSLGDVAGGAPVDDLDLPDVLGPGHEFE